MDRNTTQHLATDSAVNEGGWTVINRPTNSWRSLSLRELLEYRDLLGFLTWRDITVRYKQTMLGLGWAILQPVFSMIVFTVIFDRVAKISTDGIPYPIFSYVGLLPWTFFSSAVTNSSQSLLNNARLLTKVYFPRLVLPISGVLSALVDFFIAASIMLVLMLAYHTPITPLILLLPLFLLLAFITTLGLSFWLSALTVEYRDIRYILPFMLQMLMFLTPVVYSATMLNSPFLQTLSSLNPMAGVIDGFRWVLLGSPAPGPMLYVSVVAALVLLITGAFYFRRMEKTFADVV